MCSSTCSINIIWKWHSISHIYIDFVSIFFKFYNHTAVTHIFINRSCDGFVCLRKFLVTTWDISRSDQWKLTTDTILFSSYKIHHFISIDQGTGSPKNIITSNIQFVIWQILQSAHPLSDFIHLLPRSREHYKITIVFHKDAINALEKY